MINLALTLDLIFQVIHFVSQILYFSVQFSNILIYEVILLLLLQKSWGYFFQVINTTLFFNLLESFSDGFHRFSVIFYHLDPFFVFGYQMSHSIAH